MTYKQLKFASEAREKVLRGALTEIPEPPAPAPSVASPDM
jgi:hypothetical protein